MLHRPLYAFLFAYYSYSNFEFIIISLTYQYFHNLFTFYPNNKNILIGDHLETHTAKKSIR